MQDLRLVGVQEDGEHLLLAGPDGTHFRLALDEPLRAAARRDRPRLGQLQIEIDGGMRPREVQSLIRAGASAEEVADRAGWTVEKVGRYEGPILAERVHVADQARLVRVRSRGGATGSTVPTLQGRVAQRMRERGVDPESSVWDAWRGVEETLWTVVLTFAAGGRQRQAAWTYDPVLRTVEAADDEARWLSADEPTSMGPLPTSTPRVTNVYDVEAEGGVAASARRKEPAPSPERTPREEPLDLMTAMRERASARGKRSGGRRKSAPAQTPVDDAPRDDALPLEDIAYDPETMPPPPAARGTHPDDEADAVGDDVMPAAPAPEEAEATATQPADTEVAAETLDPDAEDAVTTRETPVAEQPAAEQPVAEQAVAEQDVVEEPAAATDADTEAAADVPDAELEAQAPPVEDAPAPAEQAAEPVTEVVAEPVSDTVGDTDEPAQAPAPEPEPAPSPGPARPARKKGRPSVPSWDDVVFGAKPRD